MELSANPLAEKTHERYSYKDVDWDKFRNLLGDTITLDDLDGKSLEEVENEVEAWYNAISSAKDSAIPK